MNIAVVTGASSGMGKEFVLQLSQYVQVDQIWVIARRQSALEQLQQGCTVPVRPIVLDLCQPESFQTYARLLEQEKPDVKLLVNAAGFGKFGAFQNVPMEDDLRMIDLNCKALVVMTRLTLPYMAPGSHILQLDSLSAFQPVPYLNTYAATKAFVLSYTRGLNRELRGSGIRMMAMNPGWVKTEFFDHAVHDDTVTYYNRIYTAEQVVSRAMRDMKKGKDVSICGKQIRAQVRLTKLLPHKLVMNIWCKQQKK